MGLTWVFLLILIIKKNIVLGKAPTQGLGHTLTAEKCTQLILQLQKKICLSLHYSGANSYLFVNDTEIIKFKTKDSEIASSPLWLGSISKDWSVDNMKKQALMDISMILVQIMKLLILMILKTFKNIWWKK